MSNDNGNGKRSLPQLGEDPVANLPVMAGFRASEKVYVEADGLDGDLLGGGEPGHHGEVGDRILAELGQRALAITIVVAHSILPTRALPRSGFGVVLSHLSASRSGSSPVDISC